MATFEQRQGPDGLSVWRVKVRRKGAKPVSATFQRLTDARKWAQKTEVAIAEGKYLFTIEAKRHTLGELIDRYMAEVLPRKSPQSVAVQRLHLRRWRAEIGHLLLADVTPAVIVEQRDKLAQQYAPASVRAHLDALSHALAVAVREWQWLETSPMRSVRRPRLPQERVRFLSDTEREQLLVACQQSAHSALYPLVVLALSTGCRKIELLTLTWQDVDLKRGRITLHHTKNRERRTLPLTGLALVEMKRLARVRRLDTSFIFSSKDGAGPMDIWRPWKRALQEAGIEIFAFTICGTAPYHTWP
jgi:integrase